MTLLSAEFQQQLKQLAISKPQAILLEGVAGFGANYEALCLAQALQENQKGEVQHIRKPQDKTVIGIDQIQALYRATRGKSSGRHRIWIVDDAQLLSEAAADAFLKLLEEPPAGITFILSVDNVQKTLPTIRSRCRLVRSVPIETTRVQQYLAEKNISTADQRQLTFLCGGSANELVNLLEDDTHRKDRLSAAHQAKILVSGNTFEQIALCASVAGSRIVALEVVDLALRMLMSVSANQASQPGYTRRLELLSEAYQRIVANGNIRVQLLRAIVAR